MKYIVAGLIMLFFGAALLSQGLKSGNMMTIYIGLGALLIGIGITGGLVWWGIKRAEARMNGGQV